VPKRWSINWYNDIHSCQVGSEANDRTMWSRNLGKCMYVCMFVKCLLLGPTCKFMRTKPQDNAQHMLYTIKHFTCFVAVLLWRDTDKMPLKLKSSETADDRVIGRGEWLPASRRHTYVAPSVWQVNSSGVLQKLRNTPLTVYTGIDTAFIFLQRDQTACFNYARSDIMKLKCLMMLISTMGPKGLT